MLLTLALSSGLLLAQAAPETPPAAAAAPTPPARTPHPIGPANAQLKFQAFSRLTDPFGTFKKWSGTLSVEGNDPTSLRGSASFAIDSIDTDIVKRDKHLRTADFFNTSKWPKAVFTLTKITVAGAGVYNVRGTLNMMGVKRGLVFPAKISVTDKVISLSAGFSVNRTKWGMKGYLSSWGMNPIKPKVSINLKATIKR